MAINGATNQSYNATANGLYAVIVNNGSCMDTSACFAVAGLNISSIQPNSIKVIPNPNDGRFKIDFGTLRGVSIRLININGQVILQAHNIQKQLHEIDIHDVAAGVYTLEVQQNKNITHLKIVKF